MKVDGPLFLTALPHPAVTQHAQRLTQHNLPTASGSPIFPERGKFSFCPLLGHGDTSGGTEDTKEGWRSWDGMGQRKGSSGWRCMEIR